MKWLLDTAECSGSRSLPNLLLGLRALLGLALLLVKATQSLNSSSYANLTFFLYGEHGFAPQQQPLLACATDAMAASL